MGQGIGAMHPSSALHKLDPSEVSQDAGGWHLLDVGENVSTEHKQAQGQQAKNQKETHLHSYTEH